MDLREKFQNIFSRITFLWMLLIFVVLVIFYAPNTSFYYKDLPHLDDWKSSGTADVITTLPEEFQQNRVICFWSNHQRLQVYLDGEKLEFSDHKEERQFSKIEASRWNRIQIPEFSAGKEIRIHNESGRTPFVKEYVYGTNEEINQWIHQHYGSSQLLDAAIIGLGFFFVVFGILSARKSAIRHKPLYLGQAMMLVGIFFRVNFKGIPIHWMSEYTKDLFGYFTFFTMTIPMFMYLSKRNRNIGFYSYACQGMALLQMMCVGIVFLLHGLEVVDISRMVWFGAAFWLILSVLAFSNAVTNFVRIKRRWTTTLALISATLLALIVPLEIVREYAFSAYVREYGTVFRVGVILIVVLESLGYSVNLQKMETQKERTEEENKKLQFQLLSSQIRPHFILNTLGAIRSMVTEDANRASDLLYDFSMYLRKNIEEKDYMKPIPFGEELDYIETYLRLEQTRFGERLKVKYDIEEKEFWVLPLTIQPFVENAVKHGLFPKKNGGTLTISTYKKNQQIVIELQDDGVGFDVNNLQKILDEKKSVGLRSAIYRIESEMRGKCNITSSEQEGTFVRVILPQ